MRPSTTPSTCRMTSRGGEAGGAGAEGSPVAETDSGAARGVRASQKIPPLTARKSAAAAPVRQVPPPERVPRSNSKLGTASTTALRRQSCRSGDRACSLRGRSVGERSSSGGSSGSPRAKASSRAKRSSSRYRPKASTATARTAVPYSPAANPGVMPRKRGPRGKGSVIGYHIPCHPARRKAATPPAHASEVACRVSAGAEAAERTRAPARPGYGSAAPRARRFLANRTTSIPSIPAARSASPKVAAVDMAALPPPPPPPNARPPRPPRPPKGERAVGPDQNQPGLRGPEPPVAEPERPEHRGLEIDVDRQHEVEHHGDERDPQVRVGGKPDAHPHRDRRVGVHQVIEVVAVARALVAAHPRQRAVEAVAQPVRDQHGARGPQPHAAERGQGVRRAGARRAEDAQDGEMIGPHHRRQPRGEGPQQPALRLGEEEGQFTRGVGHKASSRLGSSAARTARRAAPRADGPRRPARRAAGSAAGGPRRRRRSSGRADSAS